MCGLQKLYSEVKLASSTYSSYMYKTSFSYHNTNARIKTYPLASCNTLCAHIAARASTHLEMLPSIRRESRHNRAFLGYILHAAGCIKQLPEVLVHFGIQVTDGPKLLSVKCISCSPCRYY